MQLSLIRRVNETKRALLNNCVWNEWLAYAPTHVRYVVHTHIPVQGELCSAVWTLAGASSVR